MPTTTRGRQPQSATVSRGPRVKNSGRSSSCRERLGHRGSSPSPGFHPSPPTTARTCTRFIESDSESEDQIDASISGLVDALAMQASGPSAPVKTDASSSTLRSIASFHPHQRIESKILISNQQLKDVALRGHRFSDLQLTSDPLPLFHTQPEVSEPINDANRCSSLPSDVVVLLEHHEHRVGLDFVDGDLKPESPGRQTSTARKFTQGSLEQQHVASVDNKIPTTSWFTTANSKPTSQTLNSANRTKQFNINSVGKTHSCVDFGYLAHDLQSSVVRLPTRNEIETQTEVLTTFVSKVDEQTQTESIMRLDVPTHDKGPSRIKVDKKIVLVSSTSVTPLLSHDNREWTDMIVKPCPARVREDDWETLTPRKRRKCIEQKSIDTKKFDSVWIMPELKTRQGGAKFLLEYLLDYLIMEK